MYFHDSFLCSNTRKIVFVYDSCKIAREKIRERVKMKSESIVFVRIFLLIEKKEQGRYKKK